jgi:UDPglucose 6-dehydrogenase
MDRARARYAHQPRLRFAASQTEALAGADALIVATEWRSFHAPDFDTLRRSLRQKLIFDGRNIYDPAVAARHGITVVSVGRSLRTPEAGREM